MEAHAAVRGSHAVVATTPPGVDHPVDRPRIEVGPVPEDDHSRLDVVGQGCEPAPERGSGASLPFGAANDARIGLDVVGAEDDDDVLDGRTSESLQDLRKEEPLFRRAEACGRSSGENDCPDQVRPRSERQAALTFAT